MTMGRLINNTYEILDVIGKGGMSVVYKARHVRLNTICAVKEVHKNFGENVDLLAEVNILKKLDHRTLPRIIDIFEDSENIYIAEDFVTGVSLQTVIEQERVIDESRLLGWFISLAEVLVYLHGQKPHPIIYRDMKPANIMLQSDRTLKLIDFGIAREFKPERNTDTTVIGTRGYAAPEQYGLSQSDARTDIYSLGVTMYYMATGKSPYEPPYAFVPARQLNPALSTGMETILEKCVQSEPENRYQKAEDLLYDLKHIEEFDEEFKRVNRIIRNRRILTVFLYLLGTGLIIGGIFVNKAEISRQYFALINKSAEQPYADARITLEEARKLQPARSEAYEKEASLIYETGDYPETIQYINQLEESGIISMSKNPEIYNVLASSYFELNDYETAGIVYQSLSEANTQLSEQSQISYAICLGRMGELDQAQEIIQSLKNSADETQIAYLEGEIYYLNQKFSDAAQRFKDVINSSEDADLIKRAYISLAETYRGSARLSEQDPEYIPDSYSLMISTLSEAMNLYDLSGNATLWEMMGYAYYSRGTLEKDNDKDDLLASVNAYRKTISLGVQKDYLYVNIFIAYQAVGDYRAAEEVLAEMKEVYPNSYQPYMYHSLLLIMIENQKPNDQRDYREAYKEYQKASELAGSADSKEQMQQLESLIRQLKEGNWI